MSEQVTHLGVFDDCRRLALGADDGLVCEAVKRVLADRRAAGRLGTLSRGNNENLVPGALKAREHWDERQGDDQFEREFAYVLGWYVHRATDRYFKPRFREVDPKYGVDRNRQVYPRVDGGEPETLVKVYHDAVLYDRLYDEAGDPFHPGNFDVSMGGHPASDTLDVSRVESLFAGKWTAELIATYECLAGADGPPDVDAVDRALNQRQSSTYFLTRWYEEAYYTPDPRHMDRFITEPNFYDASDPIVSLARAVQRGESPDRSVSDVLEDPGDSQYAECLAQAYRYLTAASDLFSGENTPLETAETVNVDWMYPTNDDAEPHPTVDADPATLDDLPLAEVAAVEDALAAAAYDDELSESTRDILTDDPEAAHVGAAVEPGPWLVDPLDDHRQLMSYRRENSDAKVAFAGGVLAYDAVAALFDDRTRSEERLARDATVLRERTTRGEPDRADPEAIVDLFEGLVPRIRQRWHTLRADKENYAPWSQRFFAWTDALPDRRRELAEAYAGGLDVGPSFYDPSDPVIDLARGVQTGRLDDSPDLAAALAEVDGQSTYARAIAAALEQFRLVDAYASEAIDADEFQARLE
jgi:DNA segregation ATPase FtsK/SpoIIIE-like protein